MRPAYACLPPLGLPVGASALIFRPDDGTPWMARPDLTAQQFRAVLDEWRSKGYYPINAAAYPDGDTTRFGLVMVRDSSPRKWAERHGLTTAAAAEGARRREVQGLPPDRDLGLPAGGREPLPGRLGAGHPDRSAHHLDTGRPGGRRASRAAVVAGPPRRLVDNLGISPPPQSGRLAPRRRWRIAPPTRRRAT